MNSIVLLFIAVYVISFTSAAANAAANAAASELLKGYKATPDPTLTTKFQPLLVDPTGNFSLSFLRVEPGQLALSVVHVPSGESLWTAAINRPATWSKRTLLTFDGSIVISDPSSGAFWSTNTLIGDRAILSNTSNLQILGSRSPVWQSFDYPSDTLVETQNFTSNMTLISSSKLFKLRLGPNFIGLYAQFNTNKDTIYYRHTAMEARAKIIPGQGPIYIRISSDGYLGMYQIGSKPADVLPFNSYERSVPGIHRIRLESDGNLKGYYWSGSKWVSDYQAISETCELPNPCGPYGLCRAAKGCTCLDEDARPGECFSGRVSGDFCGLEKEYTVMRRTGVELPFKEMMGFVVTTSYRDCEKACESNCTCWGAVYNNASGYCYSLDYPIQTLVAIGDESKLGYFKVRTRSGNGEMRSVLGALLLVAAILAVGFGGYRIWTRKRGVRGYLEHDVIGSPAAYKHLESDSFGSIELSNR